MRRLLLASTILASPAFAQSWPPTTYPPEVTRSQSYQLSGFCDNNDMVYKWSINGAPGGGGAVPPPTTYGASFMYPWTNENIIIRRAAISLNPPAPGATTQPGWPPAAGLYMPSYSFLMIGNNAWGDEVLRLPAGAFQVDKTVNMLFPGIPNKTPLTYLDLHGACSGGYWANISLAFWYSILP
jgi:hypothetical protein